MKLKLALTSLFTVLVATQVVLAQPPAPPSFDSLDSDKSGSLSKDEFAAFFSATPRDGRRGAGNGNRGGTDGPPGGAGSPPNPSDIFARLDSNGDGSVSKEEFNNRPAPPRSGGRPPQ